jgi:signal transduction protein with GAF and PtsI domain
LRRNPIRKGEGVTGQAVLKRQPVQVPDIAAEGAYDSRLRDLIMGSGFRALLAVPLIREDQVMGALAIARNQPGAFPQQVVDLLTTFASQSALAMQNAHCSPAGIMTSTSPPSRTCRRAAHGEHHHRLQRDAAGGRGGLNVMAGADLQKVNAAGKHLLD